MSEHKKIPVGKVKRAGKFARTGLKVGGNYIKHYAKKAVGIEVEREELDKENAEQIFETLGELKGSALKMAQMLSMEKDMLPSAYTEVFSMSQNKAPAMSGPLVAQSFRKYMGKSPHQFFDTFEKESVHAASIGQVHKATKDGKGLAVKIQYPGIAESIYSDIRMVKPFALNILGMREKDLKPFFEEVEERLGEEIDYIHELDKSVELSEACAHLPGMKFAQYYKDWSSERVLTMDWIEGMSWQDFLAMDPPQELRDKVGQCLWDFFNYQVHELRMTHADPHPGNILLQADGTLTILDFGCVKEIPNDFYQAFFDLLDPAVMNNDAELEKRLIALEMYYADDSPKDRALFEPVFKKAIALLTEPFEKGEFDFGDQEFFDRAYAFVWEMKSRLDIIRNGKPRGSRHVVFVNRTYLGLFKLLQDLKAKVKTRFDGFGE